MRSDEMKDTQILHIVGFKNSGKTTLMSRWIRLLKEKGYRVSALKQHVHQGKLKMPDEQTDSMQFYLNGADSSIVTGGGTVQIMVNETPDFHRLKEMTVQLCQPDIILVEGFKMESGEKVVILRDEEDWQTLKSLEEVQLVVGYPELVVDMDHISSRTNEQQLDEWLLNWVKSSSF